MAKRDRPGYKRPEAICFICDHVFPLSAFDFDDPDHVRAAFAPENHQWLLAQMNLSKNNKYDRKAFAVYLRKHGVENA